MDRAKGFIGVERGAFADTFLCEFETEDGTDLSAILIDVELSDGTTESRRYVPERTCRLVDNDSGPDMHCTACGGEIDDEYPYFIERWGYSRCPHCGSRIDVSEWVDDE